VGSLILKLINVEIDAFTSAKWRENLTKMMLHELGKGSDGAVNVILGMGGCLRNQNACFSFFAIHCFLVN
jgi:hypothetical protein